MRRPIPFPVPMAGLLLTLAAAPLASQTPAEVIRRGTPIGAAARADLAAVLATPEQHTAAPVLVEGVIIRSCTSKGCWMQLAPTADAEGVRVTFQDYAFFIPVNAAGMTARVEGVIALKKHTAAQARHLAEEGARLRIERDGSATEVTFVATGVELRR